MTKVVFCLTSVFGATFLNTFKHDIYSYIHCKFPPSSNLIISKPESLQFFQLGQTVWQVPELVATQVEHPQARDSANLFWNELEVVAAQ